MFFTKDFSDDKILVLSAGLITYENPAIYLQAGRTAGNNIQVMFLQNSNYFMGKNYGKQQ